MGDMAGWWKGKRADVRNMIADTPEYKQFDFLNPLWPKHYKQEEERIGMFTQLREGVVPRALELCNPKVCMSDVFTPGGLIVEEPSIDAIERFFKTIITSIRNARLWVLTSAKSNKEALRILTLISFKVAGMRSGCIRIMKRPENIKNDVDDIGGMIIHASSTPPGSITPPPSAPSAAGSAGSAVNAPQETWMDKAKKKKDKIDIFDAEIKKQEMHIEDLRKRRRIEVESLTFEKDKKIDSLKHKRSVINEAIALLEEKY
jgi:hypothetical protein